MFEEISGIMTALTITLSIILYVYRNYIKYLKKQIEETRNITKRKANEILEETIKNNMTKVRLEKEQYNSLEEIVKLLSYQLPTLFHVNSGIKIGSMSCAAGFELHFTGPSFGKELFPKMFYRFFANRESRPELHIQLTDNQVFNDIFSRAFEEKFKGNGQMDLLETEIIIAQSFCPDTVKEVCEVYRIAHIKYQKLISSIKTESE